MKIINRHLCNPDAGHITYNNRDCWCEPNCFYTLKDSSGNVIYVTEHNDDEPQSHTSILNERDKHPDWVTTMLDKI